MTAKETLINRIHCSSCDEHIFNAVQSYMKDVRGDRFNFLLQCKDLNFPDLPISKVIAQFESEQHCLLFTKWFGEHYTHVIKHGLIELFAIDMDKNLIMKVVNKENIDFI